MRVTFLVAEFARNSDEHEKSRILANSATVGLLLVQLACALLEPVQLFDIVRGERAVEDSQVIHAPWSSVRL